MSESAFQSKVIKYLERMGGYVINTHGGTQTKVGTPDLIVCWRGVFLAIELKTDEGRIRPKQKEELRKISEAGGIAMSLRPSQWESFKDELQSIGES